MEQNKKPVAKKTVAKKSLPKAKVESNSVKEETKKTPEVDKNSDVAVFSEGNLHHPSLGRLKAGYNIVSSLQAEEWKKITNKVREATPQEVASAFGV
jgi:hypothetical protein